MTAQTARPGSAPTAYEDNRHSGLLIYAAVLLSILGFFNLLDGISAVFHSSVFIAGARYVVGDLRAWGIVILALGCLQLVAAAGVVARNQLARWFAVAVIGLNTIAQMFFIPSYPFWSLLIIAVDVVALWALCVYGGRPAAAR
jgi:hypothetical protein